jgi:hypothetical protein
MISARCKARRFFLASASVEWVDCGFLDDVEVRCADRFVIRLKRKPWIVALPSWSAGFGDHRQRQPMDKIPC